MNEIQRLKAENHRLRALVYRDDLTKINNSRWIRENAQSHSGFFILVDLDNFKKVNDTYGYEAGDNVLKEFANFLSENTRTTNGRKMDIARRGGDEFLILTDSIDAAKNICKRISRWHSVWYNQVTASCGFGVNESEANKVLHDAKSLLPNSR